MNTEKLKAGVPDALYKGTLMTALALSMGACTGNLLFSCIIAGIIAAVVLVIKPETSLFPMFLSFAVILSAVNTTGIAGAIITMFFAGVFVFVSGTSKTIRAGLCSPAFLPAMMISAALTITVLVTNDYFGIGANGNTVLQMLRSYRSFGFHPNWRGILYGTIVMVIMITYPRKFKRASKIVSAAFVAVAATYLLNLVLVPKGAVETFRMIGRPEFTLHSLKEVTSLRIESFRTPFYIILNSLAELTAFTIAAGDDEKSERINLYGGNAGMLIMPAFFGYTYPGKPARSTEEMLTGLISAAVMAAAVFPTGFFARLPVASCAVVLIVGIWQQVKWGKLKDAFSSVSSALIFVFTLLLSMLTNLSAGIVAGLLICSVSEKIKEIKAQKKSG